MKIPQEYEKEWQIVEAKAKAEFMEKHKPRINPHVWLVLGLLCLGWLMHREYQEERIQQAIPTLVLDKLPLPFVC